MCVCVCVCVCVCIVHRCEREEERNAWSSRAEEMSAQLKSATDKLTHAHKSKKKVR